MVSLLIPQSIPLAPTVEYRRTNDASTHPRLPQPTATPPAVSPGAKLKMHCAVFAARRQRRYPV